MEMMYEESTTSTTAGGSPRRFAFGEAGRLARGAEPLVEWAKYGIELGSHQRAHTADGAYGGPTPQTIRLPRRVPLPWAWGATPTRGGDLFADRKSTRLNPDHVSAPGM